MREISYRVWLKKQKQMLQVHTINLEYKIVEYLAKDGNFYSAYYGDCSYKELPVEKCIVLEYTGLKDKNGVKIYEGDILATSNDNPEFDIWGKKDMGYGVVNFDLKYGIFVSKWHSKLYNEKESIYSLEFIEVIGNIHENPELLNETQ